MTAALPRRLRATLSILPALALACVLGCGPAGADDSNEGAPGVSERSGALALPTAPADRAHLFVLHRLGSSTIPAVPHGPGASGSAVHWFTPAAPLTTMDPGPCVEICAHQAGVLFLECIEGGPPTAICLHDPELHACLAGSTDRLLCEELAWQSYDACLNDTCN